MAAPIASNPSTAAQAAPNPLVPIFNTARNMTRWWNNVNILRENWGLDLAMNNPPMPFIRTATNKPISFGMAAALCNLSEHFANNGHAVLDLLLAEALHWRARPGQGQKHQSGVVPQDVEAVRDRLLNANSPVVLAVGPWRQPATSNVAQSGAQEELGVSTSASGPPQQPSTETPQPGKCAPEGPQGNTSGAYEDHQPTAAKVAANVESLLQHIDEVVQSEVGKWDTTAAFDKGVCRGLVAQGVKNVVEDAVKRSWRSSQSDTERAVGSTQVQEIGSNQDQPGDDPSGSLLMSELSPGEQIRVTREDRTHWNQLLRR